MCVRQGCTASVHCLPAGAVILVMPIREATLPGSPAKYQRAESSPTKAKWTGSTAAPSAPSANVCDLGPRDTKRGRKEWREEERENEEGSTEYLFYTFKVWKTFYWPKDQKIDKPFSNEQTRKQINRHKGIKGVIHVWERRSGPVSSLLEPSVYLILFFLPKYLASIWLLFLHLLHYIVIAYQSLLLHSAPWAVPFILM